MTTRDARVDALGHWFLEVSALLAVFPWLDQLIHGSAAFNWRLFVMCLLLVLIFASVGIYFIRGND